MELGRAIPKRGTLKQHSCEDPEQNDDDDYDHGAVLINKDSYEGTRLKLDNVRGRM